MGLFSGQSRRRSARTRRRAKGIPLLRFFGPGITLVALLAAGGLWLTGEIDFSSLDPTGSEVVQTAYQTDRLDGDAAVDGLALRGPSDGESLAGKSLVQTASGAIGSLLPLGGPADTAGRAPQAPSIRIATFNIKQFGPKKAADPIVIAHVARLVSRFDVIAIQEVHGDDAQPIRALIDELRSGSANYAATVSEKIGAGDRYKEAYAFLWNERTIEMIAGSDYVVADPGGRMAREPMACSFRCRLPASSNVPPFSFTLINVHTSPSQVADNAVLNEMDVLDDVYLSIAQYSHATMAEDDVILLGDLNVDHDHLRELGQIDGLRSVGGLQPTNIRGTKIYDHIVIDSAATAEYRGRSGVVDVAAVLQIDPKTAETISDHRPVWAEFSAIESGVQTASTTRIIR